MQTERYKRQTILPELGLAGQERLAKSKVLVIGAGGLGCPLLTYLAAAGVGTITLLDDDVVSESNLQRQVLFRTTDVGKKKVVLAKEILERQNPHVLIRAVTERLSVSNVRDFVPEHDLVLDGSDNFGTSYLINDACIEYQKPFIAASLFKFTGQVSTFNYPYADGRPGPSYRCLFPSPPSTLEMPACQDAGMLGSVAGTIACVQAIEALKVLGKFGTPLVGVLYCQDLLNSTVQRLTFDPVLETIEATKIESQEYYDRMNSCMAMKEISYEGLESLRAEQDCTLLDVREDDERSAANIGGLHIPLGQLQQRLAEVPLDKPLVCYCKSGGRSARALEFIEQQCNPEVDLYNLVGGMDAVS